MSTGDYTFGHCEPDELGHLVSLANRVFRPGGGGDMGGEYPLLFDRQNLPQLLVARRAGRPVAHVGLCLREVSLLGARLGVASVGAVCTDPEHRGQGLASRLMEQARAAAVERGAVLMLISGGRGLYHRLGWVQVGSFPRYSVPAGPPESGVTVTGWEEADLPRLAALYQGEPVRFLRPAADWRALLRAGRLMNQPAELLVVRRNGEGVAYAGVQLPGPRSAAARAMELAGCRSALAAALPGIARRLEAPEAQVVTGSTDLEFRLQAASRGWASGEIAFPGTLGILDPARFLAAVSPLLAERAGEALRLEPEGEGAVLHAGGRTVRLAARGELAALLFGGTTEEARALPALPGAAAEAVRQALPLPLPWYGYNYV